MAKKTFGKDTYADGENPNGCISQTPDETLRNYEAMPRQEYKFGMKADGERWNNGFADRGHDPYADMPAPVVAVRSRKRR